MVDIKNKNRARVKSDNYEIILFFNIGGKLSPINGIKLTQEYGLTEFDWEDDDTLIKRKPCTRVEHVSFVKYNGTDLNFTFVREHIPSAGSNTAGKGHISNLLIAQNNLLLNAPARRGSNPNETNVLANFDTGTYKLLGQQFYTNEINNANNKQKFKANEEISRFNSPLGYCYLQLNCSILVRVKEYTMTKTDEFDGIMFENVNLYKLTEKVTSDNKKIVNTLKGFSPFHYKKNEGKTDQDYYPIMIENQIRASMNKTSGLNDYLRRVIINPNNKKI